MKKKEIESQEETVLITVQNLFDLCDQVREKYENAGVDDIYVVNDYECDIISISRDRRSDNIKAELRIKMETYEDFKFEV